MAIDRAVLLPGEELMLWMDGEKGRQEDSLNMHRDLEKVPRLAGEVPSPHIARQRSKSWVGRSSGSWADASSSSMNRFSISKWGGPMGM